MRASKVFVRSLLIAACTPVVGMAQTVVFSENFDGAGGGTQFNSFLTPASGSDATWNGNFDYSSFQYKRFSDATNFTQQPIPAAPGGSTTKGLRITNHITATPSTGIQLIPQLAGGGNVQVSEAYKMTFDVWMNYNGPNGGGASSTEHFAAGLNYTGTGVAGFALPGQANAQDGYTVGSDGEGGNTGDYRLYYKSGSLDDGPTFEKDNGNWAAVPQQAFDPVTGQLTTTTPVNPDEAQNPYMESIFPATDYETPGAPGKHWVSVTIEQHGNVVEYSLNGKQVASLFLREAGAGAPTLGFFDRNAGIPGGGLQDEQFVLYDNIVITQQAPLSKFTATSGTYANPANWSNGVPNGIGKDAIFDGASGASNLTVGAPVTLRSMAFNSANSYTVGGGSTITLSGSSSGNSSTVACNTGTHTVSAPINSTDHLSLYVAQGAQLTLSNLTHALTKNISRTGQGTLIVNKLQADGLTLTNGTTQLAPNGGTSHVGILAFAPGTPVLDLTNNPLVVDYTLRTNAAGTSNNDPFVGLRSSLATASGSGWQITRGITSSLAAADVSNGAPHPTAVGYAEASVVLGPGGGTFYGETVDSTAVLLKYTYLGDANLDGKVNALDFNALAVNFGTQLTSAVALAPSWSEADFNFDGMVNTTDFDFMALNYNLTMPSAALGSLVPEPGSMFAVAAMSLAVARRRSRRVA